MLKQVEILGKKYPYFISAYSLINYQKIISDGIDSPEKQFNAAADLLYIGIKDGSRSLPFWKRFFIPSKSKLLKMVSVHQLAEIVSSELNLKSEESKPGK